MTDWWSMGGYAGYVWGSYGVAAAAIALEAWLVVARRRKALRAAAIEMEGRDAD